MLPYDDVHLIADPLYGYTRITVPREPGEAAEADIIDDPWVQRLKRVHQLQSSWWVFPTAEHSRFAHSLGVMHLAGELARQVYPTLAETLRAEGLTPAPSLPLVEETLRLAGLLHDVGHGPFSHFFDEEYLHPRFGLNHELLSQHLITHELAPAIAALGRSPSGSFAEGEAVDPAHVARLVHDGDDSPSRAAALAGAPPPSPVPPAPRWVELLRLALCGAITVDNLDYVRRDAYQCGVALGAVDVQRLIYYSFVTAEGLTYHKRAIGALRAFLNARYYMYENVYFHRIGRAIDLHLREIFAETMELVQPRSPLDDLAAYRRLTEWSLFTEVERWLDEPEGSAKRRRLGEEWQAIIHRDVKYRMVYEQSVERQQVQAAIARHDPRRVRGRRAARSCRAALRDLAVRGRRGRQDPRPLNPMRGPKRIPSTTRRPKPSRSSCSPASSSSCPPRRTCTACSRPRASTPLPWRRRRAPPSARSARRVSPTCEAAAVSEAERPPEGSHAGGPAGRPGSGRRRPGAGRRGPAERPGGRPEPRFNLFLRLWIGRGYTRLAERYPAADQPKGARFENQSIELADRVRHKHVRLVAAREGLYVKVRGIVMMFVPELLIPWSEVTVGEKTSLYGRRARRLTCGRPAVGSLVVWQQVYEACRQYRRAGEAEGVEGGRRTSAAGRRARAAASRAPRRGAGHRGRLRAAGRERCAAEGRGADAGRMGALGASAGRPYEFLASSARVAP